MDWWRAYNGISTDIKWLRVMDDTGADGAQINGVWLALMDCASQAAPRGSVAAFDAENFAAFARMDRTLLTSIVDSMRRRGLIVDDQLRKWPSRQPKDPTAARRQKNYRDRKKAQAKQQDAATVPSRVTLREETMAGRNVTRDEVSVTPSRITSHREELLSSALDLVSSQASNSHSPKDFCATRASEALKPGDIWAQLAAAGIQVAYLSRRWHTTTIRTWTDAGLNAGQLREAIERAQAKRERDQDASPIPIGLVATFVTEVLDGQPRFKPTGGSYAAGDELSRQHATGIG